MVIDCTSGIYIYIFQVKYHCFKMLYMRSFIPQSQSFTIEGASVVCVILNSTLYFDVVYIISSGTESMIIPTWVLIYMLFHLK